MRELSAAILMSFIALVTANCGGGYWDRGEWGHMMPYGYGGILMWIVPLVVIGVVIYLLIQIPRKTLDSSFRETPMDILKKRYAKGEISKDEFEQMKKDLED